MDEKHRNEIEAELTIKGLGYEQVRQIADEMSERVNQALAYIENLPHHPDNDAYTEELGMVEDILRGLVDIGPIEARYVPQVGHQLQGDLVSDHVDIVTEYWRNR